MHLSCYLHDNDSEDMQIWGTVKSKFTDYFSWQDRTRQIFIFIPCKHKSTFYKYFFELESAMPRQIAGKLEKQALIISEIHVKITDIAKKQTNMCQ